MALRSAERIDENFLILKTVTQDGLTYCNAEDLDVYGVKYIDGIYRRMKYDDALAVSENVALISSECADGRVCFATDSPYIAIFVKYRSVSKVSNYSHTATRGFDLYSEERKFKIFVRYCLTKQRFDFIIYPSEHFSGGYTTN